VYFRDIRHQARALSIIRRGLQSGRTPHAYLFDGPAGVGKEMAGRALAARLLCLDPVAGSDEEPCGSCQACQLFASGNHPDFHLIHRGLHRFHPDRAVRARKGLFLAVDLVRHFLIEPSLTKPMVGTRRVFVVRDAELMNEGAQNALLKTLEEPPGQACLILMTAAAERLLPTIRSRCQRIPFDLLPPDFVEARLREQWAVPPAAARSLARLADGQLGVAVQWYRADLLQALDDVAAILADRAHQDATTAAQALLEVAGALAGRQIEAAQSASDAAGDEDEDAGAGRTGSGGRIPTDALRDAVKLTLRLIAVFYRDGLLMHTGACDLVHLTTHAPVAQALADDADAGRLADRLDELVVAERMIDGNVAPQLACERLMAALRGHIVGT
jgi:DNA polymerase-3 subunit delta'